MIQKVFSIAEVDKDGAVIKATRNIIFKNWGKKSVANQFNIESMMWKNNIMLNQKKH